MELLELALLAVASAFWPILIAVDLVALRAPRPLPLLAWFLAGGLLTTVTEGLIIVFVLQGSTLASDAHRSAAGWVDVAAGLAAFGCAALVRSRKPRPKERPRAEPRWERALSHGGGYAFGAGVVLNLLPGVFPLLALRNIAALDYPDGVKALLVVALYLVMFALVEVPLVGLLVAPDWTEPMVGSLNRWLDRNGRRIGVDVLVGVGIFLCARGIVQLA
jgi:hypothetical protein